MIAADRSRRQGELTFSVLVRELGAVYREQPRAFHVIAARYYLGVETHDELCGRAKPTWRSPTGFAPATMATCTEPELTEAQVQDIINNR